LKEKIAESLKFLFFVLLIPVAIGVTAGFLHQFQTIKEVDQNGFLLGVSAFLIIYLFVYEPQGIYQYGYDLVGNVFQFFAPLVKVAPFVLPIYSLFILIIYFFTLFFPSMVGASKYFMFLTGFTLSLHFIFTAKSLRAKDNNIAKAHYLFSMILIYIPNVIILALLFDLIYPEFSFPKLFVVMANLANGVYTSVFNQLFIP